MPVSLRKLLEDIAREFRSEPNIFYEAATRANPTAVRRAKLVDRIERALKGMDREISTNKPSAK